MQVDTRCAAGKDTVESTWKALDLHASTHALGAMGRPSGHSTGIEALHLLQMYFKLTATGRAGVTWTAVPRMQTSFPAEFMCAFSTACTLGTDE